MMSTFATTLLSVAATSFWWINTAEAHGYTTISRNFKCVNGSNFACGSIIYEPQSLEAPKGFPGAGPADGKIASAGVGRFSQLDEQTLFRWLKTDVQEGPLDFTWKFAANHRTTGYEYFITKVGWNLDAPLTRAQFDLTPFCTVNGGGTRPPITGVTHNCNLPARDGYHVILAVWTIDDTAAAFYNVNDVQFGGVNPPSTPTPTPPTPPSPVAAPTLAPVNAPSGPSGPTPTPPPPGDVCSTDLALEAVDDCTAFVYCVNGAVYPNSKVACASGLLFDNGSQICDWASNVDCAVTVPTPPAPPTVPNPLPTQAPVAFPAATNAPVLLPPGPPAVCAAGQVLAPVDDCTAFVHCVKGGVLPNSKVSCPAGLLFSSTTLVCDWPANVICN